MPYFPPPAAAGSATVTQVEVDFGSTPTRSRTFTIVDAAVSATSKIVVIQSGEAATGHSQDENEIDTLIFKPIPALGSFDVYAESLTGPVVGVYKLNYLIGA